MHQDGGLQPYVDSDAYAIYGILLESTHLSYFVIESETEFFPTPITPQGTGIKGDHKFDQLWGAALKDYAQQFQTPRLLSRNFNIDACYRLVPKESIDAVLKSGGGWNGFYERYSPEGFYWFSAVGFNSQKTRAIVTMNHFCGPLCGGGRPYFFEKLHGKWSEVSVNAEVSQWAS